MKGHLFNLAGAIYAAALLFYAMGFFSRKRVFELLPTGVMRAGWAIHTFALFARWSSGGLFHPPWVNLYETLVFSSWVLVTFHLWSEIRRRHRWTGLLASALAFVALGLAA